VWISCLGRDEMKIKDLNFDKNNYNNGNEFGNSLIEKSLRNNGAGRSILLDKNNNIIAGNKTAENAGAIGLDDVIIVDSDGTKLIAVRRTDIDIHSKQGKELALADNATSKANITWNHEALKEDWGDDELKAWGLDLPKFEQEYEEIIPSGYEENQRWFLNIEFDSEQNCQEWYDKLTNEGLICKIVQ
jgi:hypothetical protein